MSSAKRTVESGGKTEGRSLMKVEKREGSSTEPWGTPEVGKPREEEESPTRVTWERSDKYDLNQAVAEGERPIWESLAKRRS